jgi:LysM repeat protein
VPGSYEIVDGWIGRIAAKLDPDTTILIVSDHGFQSSGGAGGSTADLAHVGGSGTHAAGGVLIAAGPAIARGASCEAASYDVVPTVLAALGLPGTTQAIGHVLKPLLDPDFLARHPLQPPRDEPPRASAGTALQGPDVERLRNLRAIGYVLGATEEVPGAVEDGAACVPAAGDYVVQAGATLADIARRLLGGAEHAAELARRNGLAETATLKPGQVLHLH